MENEIMKASPVQEDPVVAKSTEGAQLEQMKETLRYELQSKVMKRMAEKAIYRIEGLTEGKERLISDDEYDKWAMEEWDEKGYSTLFGSFIDSVDARELMQKYAGNDKKLVDILARMFENTELVQDENKKPYRAFKWSQGNVATLN